MSANLAFVSAELKALPQWVGWRYEVRGDGKKTKVPRQVHASKQAESNNPATWTTFEAATGAEGFDGVGFVFSPDDPFSGIDFDGCLVDGELAEWARPWLARFAGSYMEISPSGKGIKVWCRGRTPGGKGKNLKLPGDHQGIEAYSQGRFFCVTGDVFGDIPAVIANHQETIDALVAWMKERKEQENRSKREAKTAAKPASQKPFIATASNGPLSNEDRAIRYLATIEGAVSDQGGHNKTMYAACKVVEFGITDVDRVYQILRDHYNGRCQPPWEDHELRHKAEDAVEEAEAGKKLKEDRPRVGGNAKSADGPKPPRQIDVDLAKKMCTDMGNGVRLATRAGGRLRYCKPWGKWLAWDGKRYALDQTGEADRMAKEAARMILSEAAMVEDDDKRKRHVEHAKASQSRGRLAAMLEMAASEPGIPILPDEMDRDGWLLNCANGTIDLKTGRLKPHDQADVLTQLCPVDFEPEAECPLWNATLDLFFAGDRKLIAYWQRVCGYVLVGVVRDHVMPVAYGQGSNGKSTILGTLMEMLGRDYAMKAPPDLLMAKSHDSHPTDKAGMFRKRLVVAIETAEGRRLDEVAVKELTGGDRITARRMREDFWEFTPSHTLLMATNHRPTIRGTDHGIWRRLKLVPFTVKVEGAQADTAMGEKLRAEFPGILAWCVRGCLSWQEIGLQEPESITEATTEYREEQDVIGTFLAERTLVDPSTRSKCMEVYKAYESWAEAAGERVITLTDFGKRMKDRGIGTIKSGVKWYVGVGLKQADDAPWTVVA